ncbi:MAG: bifunctional non-ous end joining protein LigD [Actinomycetota bacterium]|nr:bifunctional non-ous end joining protein LigD [Actinomycetota bacterium]
MPATVDVEIEGRHLSLSNLDKVLYPDAAFTKADVIDYYRRIAPVLLPHLHGRVPTLVRAPDGAAGQVFFEKRCPGHRPKWVKTAVIGKYERHTGFEGCLIESLPALVWVANLAALELHTYQAGIDDLARPTALVIDLDPGEPATIVDCARVALDLRDTLDTLGLAAVVKTSGSKGLHLSVPLNTPGVTDDATKSFSLALGQLLESRDPKRVTTVMAREHRRGRVFVDWSQNDRAKTTVAPYSLRIKARPLVSTPLGWTEVEAAHKSGDGDRLTFEARAVLERVVELGDLYEPNLTLQQELPSL